MYIYVLCTRYVCMSLLYFMLLTVYNVTITVQHLKYRCTILFL